MEVVTRLRLLMSYAKSIQADIDRLESFLWYVDSNYRIEKADLRSLLGALHSLEKGQSLIGIDDGEKLTFLFSA